MKLKHWTGALLMSFVLVGCGTTGGTGAGSTTTTNNEPQSQGAEQPRQRVVHFAYDSSEISSSDMRVLQAHAKYLAENPSERVRVEGHADERGSAEYNLALGERRANAVKRALTLHGASARQIETVSYGETRPVSRGSDERSWAQNRRAEVDYR